MFDVDEYRERLKRLGNHRLFPYGIAVLRGVLIYAVYALMCSITLYYFRKHYLAITAEVMPYHGIVQMILEVILLFLMLNTVILTFAIYNKRERIAFLASHETNSSQYDPSAEYARLISSKHFYIELATGCVCFLILPTLAGYENFVWWGKENPVLAKLTSTLVFAIAFFLISLFARIDAQKMWLELPSRLSKKQKWKSMRRKKAGQYSYWRMALRLVGYAALYAASMQIVSFVLAMIVGLVGMIGLILFTPILLSIVLAILFLYYFGAIRTRVKFIRKLKRTCHKYGFDLFELKRPYRSIFRDHASYNFALTANQKTYYCRMLASVKRSNKLILDVDGTCTRYIGLHIPQPQLSSVRGFVQSYDRGNGDDREFMSFSSIVDYRFEADGNKILIINPVPKRVLYRVEKTTREMDNGDKIGEYTVYTGNAFLRSLERDSTVV